MLEDPPAGPSHPLTPLDSLKLFLFLYNRRHECLPLGVVVSFRTYYDLITDVESRPVFWPERQGYSGYQYSLWGVRVDPHRDCTLDGIPYLDLGRDTLTKPAHGSENAV